MLTLHHAPRTRAGRIVWLFEELGLAYQINRTEFSPKALKSDDHRARHPLGRVPVLEDDDVIIYESGAIIEYVLACHGDGGLKPAVEAPEFPIYLQWFHYCEGMVMPPINTIVVQTLLLPPERRNDEILGQARRLLSKSVTPIDADLRKKEYLAGNFSAADIMLGHAIYISDQLNCVGNDMENLKTYIERLKSRSAFHTAIIME